MKNEEASHYNLAIAIKEGFDEHQDVGGVLRIEKRVAFDLHDQDLHKASQGILEVLLLLLGEEFEYEGTGGDRVLKLAQDNHQSVEKLLLEVSGIAELSHIINGRRHTLYLIYLMNVFTVHAFEQLLKDGHEIVVQAPDCIHFVCTHYEVSECSHHQG